MTVHCQVDVLPILARGDVVLLRMVDRLVISASVMPWAFVMLVTVGQRRRGWLLEVVLSLFVRKDEHERKREEWMRGEGYKKIESVLCVIRCVF